MKPKQKVLANGLRIVAVPVEDNPTVTVLVLVEAGSHYESKGENGISHFLEHMCFKGTSNRPSPIAIAQELDGLGATSNAFTWYEFTGYHAKARTKHFTKLLDIIADVYLHSTVPENELEKEKGVIIEEINMYDDLPMRDVGRLLDLVLYGDQPAGRSVLGTKEAIRKMKRDEFLAYRAAHYVPKATTVVVAGGINAHEVFKAVEHYFINLPKRNKPKKPPVSEKQRSPNVGLKYKKSSQAHFQIGFRGIPAGHKDAPIVDILRTVLGAGMSSRLFRKLREEMGVCYYVRAETESHSDHGKFVISSGVDIARIDQVLKVIRDELRTIRVNLVDDSEVRKAKEYLLGNMVMGLETSDEIAEYFGVQEILHQPLMTVHEYRQKILDVTADDLKRVAGSIFQNDKLNVAVIGPFKDKRRFKAAVRL
jgi:predicted Zn-dependent peptidase